MALITGFFAAASHAPTAILMLATPIVCVVLYQIVNLIRN